MFSGALLWSASWRAAGQVVAGTSGPSERDSEKPFLGLVLGLTACIGLAASYIGHRPTVGRPLARVSLGLWAWRRLNQILELV